MVGGVSEQTEALQAITSDGVAKRRTKILEWWKDQNDEAMRDTDLFE